MEKIALKHLEMLNQIKLDDTQRDDVLSFFAKREEERLFLAAVDTSAFEPMIHILPVATPLREDVAEQAFTREQLQAQAPATDAGYWYVPRIME